MKKVRTFQSYIMPDYEYTPEDSESIMTVLKDAEDIHHQTWHFPDWVNLEALDTLEQTVLVVIDQLAGEMELWESITDPERLAPINATNPILTKIHELRQIIERNNHTEEHIIKRMVKKVWELLFDREKNFMNQIGENGALALETGSEELSRISRNTLDGLAGRKKIKPIMQAITDMCTTICNRK